MKSPTTSFSAAQLRRLILEESKRAHVGHIGSSLSIADIMTTLYADVLRIESPTDPQRDRFILSKGHAALCLYVALHLKGWIDRKQLSTYCAEGSQLGVHPEHHLPGVDFSTGSLGMGLSFATGRALGDKKSGNKNRVFVLSSDAECNEGVIWEATMFAAQHQLSNLILMVDYNQQQAFGYTKEVLDMSPMRQRWASFGWDAHDVDGHDRAAMASVISNLNTESGAPHVLIAHTTFGKGVSYMENKIKWHYWPMTDDEFSTAIKEVEATA